MYINTTIASIFIVSSKWTAWYTIWVAIFQLHNGVGSKLKIGAANLIKNLSSKKKGLWISFVKRGRGYLTKSILYHLISTFGSRDSYESSDQKYLIKQHPFDKANVYYTGSLYEARTHARVCACVWVGGWVGVCVCAKSMEDWSRSR